MEQALAWVGQIAEWIGRFVPRWELLDVTHEAIKIVRGRWRVRGWRLERLEQAIVVCKPDRVHFWWPVTTVWFEHPVARQTVNLPSQTITLADGRTVAVSGLVVFEVADIQKLLCQTYGPDDAVRDISLTAVHDACCQYDWAGLQAAQRDGTLDRKLKADAKKELDRYGCRVLKMALTDLAPCRVLKVMQTVGKD